MVAVQDAHVPRRLQRCLSACHAVNRSKECQDVQRGAVIGQARQAVKLCQRPRGETARSPVAHGAVCVCKGLAESSAAATTLWHSSGRRMIVHMAVQWMELGGAVISRPRRAWSGRVRVSRADCTRSLGSGMMGHGPSACCYAPSLRHRQRTVMSRDSAANAEVLTWSLLKPLLAN